MKLALFLILLTATMPALAGWFEQPVLRKIVIVNNGKQYTVDEDYFSCIAGTPIHRVNNSDSRGGHSRVVLNGSCYIKGAKP